jgi:hypothetical protein
MLSILSEKIRDNRFLRLMRNMLKAGYLEDWKWHATLSGVPQGAGVSTILSKYLPAQAGRDYSGRSAGAGSSVIVSMG